MIKTGSLLALLLLVASHQVYGEGLFTPPPPTIENYKESEEIATSSSSTNSTSHAIDGIYNQTLLLEKQVEAFREAQSVNTVPQRPPVQTSKLYAHLYAKYLEVEGKIVRLQGQLGVEKLTTKRFPYQFVTSEQLAYVLEESTQAMNEVLDNEMIDPPENIAKVSGKSVSNAYEKLWEISYLLDDVIGPPNSTKIYTHLQTAYADLEAIAQHLKVKTSITLPLSESDSPTAADSNIVGFRNMYKLARLQRTLGMKAVRVPSFPVGKITPADTYDTSDNIIVELARIKGHLNIQTNLEPSETPETITPAQVLQSMETIGHLTEHMLEQLEASHAES